MRSNLSSPSVIVSDGRKILKRKVVVIMSRYVTKMRTPVLGIEGRLWLDNADLFGEGRMCDHRN